MAIYWPTPGFKRRTSKLCVLNRWDFHFCVRSSPLRGQNVACRKCHSSFRIESYIRIHDRVYFFFPHKRFIARFWVYITIKWRAIAYITWCQCHRMREATITTVAVVASSADHTDAVIIAVAWCSFVERTAFDVCAHFDWAFSHPVYAEIQKPITGCLMDQSYTRLHLI